MLGMLEVQKLFSTWAQRRLRQAAGLSPKRRAIGMASSIPLEFVEQITARIAATVELPVTLDFEGGYSEADGCLANNIARLLDLGRSDDLRISDSQEGANQISTLIFGDRRWIVTLFGTISGNASRGLCRAGPRASAGLARTTAGS